MLCLGLESSCDETAVALVRDGVLLDSITASQTDLHALFGGVVPELASREHYRIIGPLFDRLMANVNLPKEAIDVIAVARGPGLLGSLLVGVAFAKGLALALDRPLTGVNHLHAHLLAVGLENELAWPALGVLVSGGHTHIYRIEAPWKFVQLGRSLDDAAGEAFDKTGNALGLSYPAGRHMDELARKGVADARLLPRPYLDNDNLDFSFSGLKTAALEYRRRNIPQVLEGAATYDSEISKKVANFCASFNLAVAETLVEKTARALARQNDVKDIWLAGGVAANSMIRSKFEELAAKHGRRLLVPTPRLCTDNAAMIAYAGFLLAREGYCHSLDLETVPRGRAVPDDMRKYL